MADITYVATREGWLYIAGVKDVYTSEIVGYAMGERMTKELTGKALFMALRNQRSPAGQSTTPIVVHSTAHTITGPYRSSLV